MPAGSLSDESSPPGLSEATFSLCPYVASLRMRRSLVVLLIRTLILSCHSLTLRAACDTLQSTALGIQGPTFSADPSPHASCPHLRAQVPPRRTCSHLYSVSFPSSGKSWACVSGLLGLARHGASSLGDGQLPLSLCEACARHHMSVASRRLCCFRAA